MDLLLWTICALLAILIAIEYRMIHDLEDKLMKVASHITHVSYQVGSHGHPNGFAEPGMYVAGTSVSTTYPSGTISTQYGE